MKHIFFLFVLAGMVAPQVHAQDTTSVGVEYDSSDYDFAYKWHRLYEIIKPIPNSGYFSQKQPFGLPSV